MKISTSNKIFLSVAFALVLGKAVAFEWNLVPAALSAYLIGADGVARAIYMAYMLAGFGVLVMRARIKREYLFAFSGLSFAVYVYSLFSALYGLSTLLPALVASLTYGIAMGSNNSLQPTSLSGRG